MVSLFVTVAESYYGDKHNVSIPFFQPTENAELFINARALSAVSFDVYSNLVPHSTDGLSVWNWRDLFGASHTDGVSGAIVQGLVRGGSLDVDITCLPSEGRRRPTPR
jgi:hypothetical protein